MTLHQENKRIHLSNAAKALCWILSLLYVLTIEAMKSSAYCCQLALLELAIRRLREFSLFSETLKIAFIHWLLFSVTACQNHWLKTYIDKKSYRDQKEGKSGNPQTLHSTIWPAKKTKNNCLSTCKRALNSELFLEIRFFFFFFFWGCGFSVVSWPVGGQALGHTLQLHTQLWNYGIVLSQWNKSADWIDTNYCETSHCGTRYGWTCSMKPVVVELVIVEPVFVGAVSVEPLVLNQLWWKL